ncbi:MAG: hypothetical protein PHC88_08925 [Terrimicrobiaceae bacterium]|nr:hypothetical protein [Terrimicrobiaceae bacterium]
MIPVKLLLGAAAAVAVGFAIPNAHAAKPDFTRLAGKYKSTYTLQTGATNVSGNVTVTVTVPSNGRKATIQILGFGTATSSPGTAVALLGNLTLNSKRVITADNILLALFFQLPAAPTHFSDSANKFAFTLAGGGGIGSGTMTYTLSFNGKRLSITGTGTFSSNPTSVTLKGVKQGK